MSKRKWRLWNFNIFFILIFITTFLSLLKGQEIDTRSIQIDTSLVKLDTNLSIQTQDSLILITDEEIRKEMQFNTREKIGACVVGGFLGFPTGVIILLNCYSYPHKIEGPGAVPIAITGGCLGVIIGAKIVYEIVEHSEKKAAKQRLIKKQEAKKRSKNNELN
jgi:hypothetical protein